MRLGRLLALLLGFALLLATSETRARERGRIVIVGVAASGALGRQLRIELAARGYDVLLLEPGSLTTREQLEHAGREPEVQAAIRVASDEGGGVEVWTRSDSAAPTLTLHSVETSHADARVTALRSAERLRASLLELPEDALPPQPPPVTSPAHVDAETAVDRVAAVRHDAPRWVLGLGAAALVSPGGLDRVLSFTPSVELWIHPNWGAALRAFLPLNEAQLTGREGTTTISTTLVGLGPSLRVRPAATRWQLDAQLALGLALLRMQASAEPPFEGHDVQASSIALMGSLAVGYQLSAAFRLSSGVLLGKLLPEAEVRFGDRTAATWGALYGGATLAVHAELD